MYQSHFHLHDRPFSSAANPEHYFPAASIEQARESIARNVERSSSVTVVTGPVGCGKTLLCQLICNQYVNELPVCVVQGESLHAAEDFLQSILHKLGLPYRGQDAGELRLVLTDHISSPGCVNGIIVIIDDADRLSPSLLDEVRAITNIVKEGQPCARVLLVGGPRLDENMANPSLESLNQRIAGRLFLDNFSYQETLDYVQARITSCGGDAQGLFTDQALEKVHHATHGVPRLVNQICDHALMLASINQSDQLTPQLIEEAWADLQQLPMPTTEHSDAMTADEVDDVIEFCTLEESSEASELGEIEQTLTDLGAEASRAARPIAVGGDIQFEHQQEHHDVKPNYTNPVLPFSISPDTESDSEALHNSSNSEAEEIDAAEFSDQAAGEEPDATQTFFFESADEEAESDITFDPDMSSQFTSSEEPQEVVDEAVFEFGEDDYEGAETSASVFEFPSAEPELSEVVGFNDGAHEDESDANDGDAIQLAEAVEDHGIALHQEPSDSEDSDDSIDVVEDESGLLTSETQHQHSVEESSDAEEDEQRIEEVPEDAAKEVAEEVAEDAAEEAAEDAAEEVAEEVAEETWHGDRPEAGPTIDQASNPFGEGFDEEIVIQQFASPSQIARECYDPVTTAYSRQLSVQLAAAHPGLRMHPASEFVESFDVAEEDGFQPLSACMDDNGFVVADEPAFSAKDDPVMPEENVHCHEANVESNEGFAEEDEDQNADSDLLTSVGVRVDASSVPENSSVVALSPKRERRFRTLFSSMRGKQQ